jgi:uncharacterized protein (UPF0276 family)
MMRVHLTANLSDGLVELIQAEAVQIDGVEVGPWFNVEQIQKYRQQLPGWTFYFHHSDLIPRLKWIPRAADSLREYIECTRSPWLSFHYSLLPPGYSRVAAKWGLYLPPPNFARSVKRFVAEVDRLKGLNLPFLLENMPSFPTSKYAFETSVETISEVLILTDADFLLDIAHARVVASVFGLDVYDYLGRLPLERLRQIHISGPRVKKGYLYDAHEDLQEEDCKLLEWVLVRRKPEVVTLEYYKDKEKLCNQLIRIKEIIAAA